MVVPLEVPRTEMVSLQGDGTENVINWRKLSQIAVTFMTNFMTIYYRHIRNYWEKLSRGVSKPVGFPLFSGKVQIVSRTLSGLFLVGALTRPRKRKGVNRENPRTIPEQIGKIPEKSVFEISKIYYLSNSKTFQDGSGNGNFEEISSDDFQERD